MSDNSQHNPEKIVLIINGEPVDVCSKSLAISLKKAKAILKTLKKQSKENAHTLRFFWTDVIMLNIITNQLIQKIDTHNLSRIIKPVDSLKEDAEEYREERKRKTNRLINAIIKANDDELPLDYSRELEKYYKINDVDINQSQEEATQLPLINTDVIEKKTNAETETQEKCKEISNKEAVDDKETPDLDEKSSFPTFQNSNSLEESIKSFTQSSDLDINSLFSED